jgi:hypothetical protein
VILKTALEQWKTLCNADAVLKYYYTTSIEIQNKAYFTKDLYGAASHITDKMHSVLLDSQAQCWKGLERIISNFKKDTASRKPTDYLKRKQEKLHNQWVICMSNNEALS